MTVKCEKAVSLVARHMGANFDELLLHLQALKPAIVPRAFHESANGEEMMRHETDMSPLEMVLLGVGPPVAITFELAGCRVWRCEFKWNYSRPGGGYDVLVGKSIDLNARVSAAEVLEAIAKQRTKQLRKASFCQYCGELVMPDSRDEKYCCMGCSERFLGVVH